MVTVITPEVVMGPPETLMPVPADRSTDVTVPPPPGERFRSARSLFNSDRYDTFFCDLRLGSYIRNWSAGDIWLLSATKKRLRPR